MNNVSQKQQGLRLNEFNYEVDNEYNMEYDVLLDTLRTRVSCLEQCILYNFNLVQSFK